MGVRATIFFIQQQIMIQHSESISNISAAILAVEEQVSGIPMSGFNMHQSYKYAKLNDYLAALKPIMQKNSLLLISSADEITREKDDIIKGANHSTDSFSVVHLSFKLIHASSGEWISISAIGEGVDRGDKATYKAITGGRKYGLALLFNLVTEDEPEGDEATDQRRSQTDYNNPQVGTVVKTVPGIKKPLEQVARDMASQRKHVVNPASDNPLTKLGLVMTQEPSQNGRFINNIIAPESPAMRIHDALPESIIKLHIRKSTDPPDKLKGMWIPGGRVSFGSEAYASFYDACQRYANQGTLELARPGYPSSWDMPDEPIPEDEKVF